MARILSSRSWWSPERNARRCERLEGEGRSGTSDHSDWRQCWMNWVWSSLGRTGVELTLREKRELNYL